MINFIKPIRHALRGDPIVQAVVGNDDDGETKVYASVAKKDVKAPYIVIQIPQIGGGPIPVYGDGEVLEGFRVVLTSWGRTADEAWQVADVADDALKRGDYSYEPYELIQLMRVSSPQELPDRDTPLRQVIVQYQLALGR